MNYYSAILQLMLTDGLGSKTLGHILKKLANEGRKPEDFVSTPVSELVDHYGIKAQIAQSIRNTRDQAEKLSEELERHSISMLIRETPEYPARLVQKLGEDAPPVLFVRGNCTILSQKAVGVGGARNASEIGLRVTYEYAKILATEGVNIVSGYANGVDIIAHSAAMETKGGLTTLVLAEGILRFKPKKEVADLFTYENHVIVSEFLPQTGWMVRTAMQRNSTICGLSNAMIIIESGNSGGTFAAGETALKLRHPLFVVKYDKPAPSAEGNSYFLKKGLSQAVRALDGDFKGKPNLDQVFSVLKEENNHFPQETRPPEGSLWN